MLVFDELMVGFDVDIEVIVLEVVCVLGVLVFVVFYRCNIIVVVDVVVDLEVLV